MVLASDSGADSTKAPEDPRRQPVGGVLLKTPALPPGTPNPPDLHLFGGQGVSSFATINLPGTIEEREKAWSVQRPAVDDAQRRLLAQRYDFTGKVSADARMSGGKPIPVGPVARLPKGLANWEALGALSADEIREKDLFPYKPLPHPLASTGGPVLPEPQREPARRFDVSFDLPDAYLPEAAPALFLTTRPDLGDVSQGHVLNVNNYREFLSGVLTGEQYEGFLLLMNFPIPADWLNQTDHRAVPLQKNSVGGLRCFDCHVNGHTDGAFALDPSTRPQLARARIDTPSLRGLHLQGPLSLKRTLMGSGHFSEVEEYVDSDPAQGEAVGTKKVNDEAIRKMEAFLNIIAFPPAPKLDVFGRLDPKKATPSELRGEALFFGKARCAACHMPPAYSDNEMHDLRVEHFYRGRAEGPAKTFPLRGIKDSPPYFHDGRLPTLEDTVEFFDLILETHLSAPEKEYLAAFMRAL